MSLSINKNIQSGSRNLPNVLLHRGVFYAERVFLLCHGPTEHTVILLGSILQVFWGFIIGLECESLVSCATD